VRLGLPLTRSRPLSKPDAGRLVPRRRVGVAGAGGGRLAGRRCTPPADLPVLDAAGRSALPPSLLGVVPPPLFAGLRRRPMAGRQWSKERSPSAAGLQVPRRMPERRSAPPTRRP
jgi:hypothetical protein